MINTFQFIMIIFVGIVTAFLVNYFFDIKRIFCFCRKEEEKISCLFGMSQKIITRLRLLEEQIEVITNRLALDIKDQGTDGGENNGL